MREAYFLDRCILYFFEDKKYLGFTSDREIYCMLKQEQAMGELQGIRLCKEKTFYKWLADGRKELTLKDTVISEKPIKLTKVAQLAQHIERLRNSMRFHLMNGLYTAALKSEKIPEIVLALEIFGISKKNSHKRN